jgi:hypothetical protein
MKDGATLESGQIGDGEEKRGILKNKWDRQ